MYNIDENQPAYILVINRTNKSTAKRRVTLQLVIFIDETQKKRDAFKLISVIKILTH